MEDGNDIVEETEELVEVDQETDILEEGDVVEEEVIQESEDMLESEDKDSTTSTPSRSSTMVVNSNQTEEEKVQDGGSVVGEKRGISKAATDYGDFLNPVVKQANVKNAELFIQHRLVVQLSSGINHIVDSALKQLAFLSYSADIVLDASAGLLDTFARLLRVWSMLSLPIPFVVGNCFEQWSCSENDSAHRGLKENVMILDRHQNVISCLHRTVKPSNTQANNTSPLPVDTEMAEAMPTTPIGRNVGSSSKEINSVKQGRAATETGKVSSIFTYSNKRWSNPSRTVGIKTALEEWQLRCYAEVFPLIPSRLSRKNLAIKILYNFSCVRSNRPTLAQNKALVFSLLEIVNDFDPVVDDEDSVLEVMETLANIAGFLRLTLEESACIQTIVDFLHSSNHILRVSALRFFQKIARQAAGEVVFTHIRSDLFSFVTEFLCLPQAFELGMNTISNMYDISSDAAKEMQDRALTLLHDLSSLRGPLNTRTCQHTGLLEVIVLLMDLPDQITVNRRAAVTLLNFASEQSNHPYIFPFLEKLLTMSFRPEAPCMRILNKILAKLRDGKAQDPFSSSRTPSSLHSMPSPAVKPQPLGIQMSSMYLNGFE